MWTDRFNTKIAAGVGNKLADDFLAAAAAPARKGRKAQSSTQDVAVQSFLSQVDRDARPLRLGMFRRAKLANTFKWRLLDKGVDRTVVDDLTQMLLLRLSASRNPAI
jgi:hypothetical protein